MLKLLPEQVSAVLVTRGDVDLGEILASLAPLGETIIWNNALEERDFKVYGRYHAIAQARHDVVYVQDDDCVLEPGSLERLLAAYEPGVAVCNVPERFRATYTDSGLVGFGAVFDRNLPERAFTRFDDDQGLLTSDDLEFVGDAFHRRADNVFTVLAPLKLVDLAYRDLAWASSAGRMWTTPGHVEERDRMLMLARLVRDGDGMASR